MIDQSLEPDVVVVQVDAGAGANLSAGVWLSFTPNTLIHSILDAKEKNKQGKTLFDL